MSAARSLVFDVGLFDGSDTAYYLSRGHRVVAVDADPAAVASARSRFEREAKVGRLQLVHAAVLGAPTETATLHVSEHPEWTSLRAEIAGRKRSPAQRIDVPTTTLPELIAEHGVPLYAKVDIEGLDAAALRALLTGSERPQFVSAETECAGDRALGDDEATETLDVLVELGYSRFKLVDQETLASVARDGSRASRRPPALLRAAQRLRRAGPSNIVCDHQGWYTFPIGASGPFGDDVAGEWLDATAARELLRRERGRYFAREDATPYGFWFDWHAAADP